MICESEAGDPPWRAAVSALHGEGIWVGVSALMKGGWSIKLIANDSVRLRGGLRAMRKILAGYFPRLACDPRKL
jgi:urease accessory protein